MSGRYAFSLPEPRRRDGWFRLGNIDVTTTALLVLCGVVSMFLYAISPSFVFNFAFSSAAVRSGEVWRLFTWPLVTVPSIWEVLGLVFFWWFGHMVEEQIGRKPYTWLVLAMTVLPAAVVSLIGVRNAETTYQWSAYSAGLSLLTLGMLVIFALDNPNARFMFGIPAWVFAAVIVGVDALQMIAARAWAQLLLSFLVGVVGLFGARQRGMLDVLEFIPRVKALSGPPPSPYGEIGSARPKQKRKRPRGKGAKGSGADVVAGPWQPTSGPTPLEQAELDVLLDRISESGIDSLTPYEKTRLQELSKRMRDS
ncbi:MAG: rhomboid family intramembrane serine protease [Acidimicrobiales bacterium]